MSDAFFQSRQLTQVYAGLTVALANGRLDGDVVPSFISSRITRERDAIPPQTSGLIACLLPDHVDSIYTDSLMNAFTASVRAAPGRWAPDGAEELWNSINQLGISMGFTDDTTGPRCDPKTNTILIPSFFLEDFWAFCFAGVVISSHLTGRSEDMGKWIQLPDTGEVGTACKMLRWSLMRRVHRIRLPYQQDIIPDISAQVGTTMNTANVVFEIGIGFLLHHELAHIVHDLRVNSLNPVERRNDENLADRVASAAYVTQLDADEKMRESQNCLATIRMHSVASSCGAGDVALAAGVVRRGLK